MAYLSHLAEDCGEANVEYAEHRLEDQVRGEGPCSDGCNTMSLDD